MLAAWGGLSAAWFSFNVTVGNDRNLSMLLPISNSGHHYQGIERYVPWVDNTKAGNAVETFYMDTLLATPVFNVIWQKAFWATILPSAIMFLILTFGRQKKKLNLLTLNAPSLSQCSCCSQDQFQLIQKLRDTYCLCCISSRCSCSSHSANCNPKMIGSIFVTCHLDDAICFIFAIIHLPMYTAIPVSA